MESEYICRFYEYTDYPMVCDWQSQYGLSPYSEEYLPSCGFVVEDAVGPVVASWLFFDSSTPVCFIGFTVVNPRLGFLRSRDAFNFLILRMKAEGMIRGAKALMAYIPKAFAWHEGYLENIGFKIEKRTLINMSVGLTEEDVGCLSM